MNTTADPSVGAKRRTNSDLRDPKTPIDGDSIEILQDLIDGVMTNMDLAFLLNVPTQQLSALRSAPSSLHVTDRRVSRNVPPEDGQRKEGQSLKCIRPYHAILIRLFLKHPEYAQIIPPRPDDNDVYELIQPFMRMPGYPLNTLDIDKSRWFAPYFGRSLVTSYKMLKGGATSSQRENSRPVVQIQTLIVLRFAHEFRRLYAEFWEKHIPKQKRSKAIYQPQGDSWDILLERDSLTEWMSNRVLEAFQAQLYERWVNWWDNCFMTTLEREAISRGSNLEDIIKTGNWTNKDDVDTPARFQKTAPITGAAEGLLGNFRKLTALSNSEMMWVLGISPKTYFRFRKQENKRLDAPVSILIRHFYHNPDDLELFIPPTQKGEEVFERIRKVDPNFERKHLGVFFGCGSIAGYNMSRPEVEVPMFARRASSLIARHIDDSDKIYWDLREAAESEAKARGIKPEDLWANGTWNESAALDESGQDAEDVEANE